VMGWLFRFYIALGAIVSFSLPVYADLPHRSFFWADDENYKPLIYRDREGLPKGIFHDVLTEAFRRMNISLQNQLYPWSRAQKIVKEGSADGMVTVYTKTRQKIFEATSPIVVVEEHVFTNKNNPKLNKILNIRSLDELKRFIIVDTVDAGWSRENLKEMHVIWVPTAESALNMIASKRADVYLMSNFTGPYFIQEQIEKKGPLYEQLREVVMGNYPITTMEYRLLIRRDSPYVNIIEQFNRVLHQMQQDGTYKKIIQRYKIDMRYKPTKKLGKDNE